MALRWFKIYDFKQHGDNPQALNSVRTIEVNNKRICLARLNDGYFSIDDKCPHAGARLGMGTCDDHGHVICPVHRYRFDLKTGELHKSEMLPKIREKIYVKPVISYQKQFNSDAIFFSQSRKSYKMGILPN